MTRPPRRSGRRGFILGLLSGGLTTSLAATAHAHGSPGPTLVVADGPPTGEDGLVGDFYVDRQRWLVFGPKAAAGSWGCATPLTLFLRHEPKGSPSVVAGAGVPGSHLGRDGAFYVRTDTAELFGPRSAHGWGSPTSLTGPSSVADQVMFRALAAEPAQLISRPTSWRHDAVERAEVRWPDGTPGEFEVLAWSERFTGTIDSFAISYGVPPTRRYLQPAVDRDPLTGAVRHRPAIAIN